MRVQDKNGKVHYKVPCDRCLAVVRVPFQPKADREITCKDCRYVAEKAKPSTHLKRDKQGKPLAWYTDCDLCGDRQKTPFMPKKSRTFLCDLCMVEARKQEAEAKEAEALARAEQEAEAREAEAAALAKQPEQVEADGPLEEAPETVAEAQAPDAAVNQGPLVGESDPVPQTAIGEAKEVALDAAAEAAAEDTDVVDANLAEAEPQQMYDVTCRRCKKVEMFRFKPARGEGFVCKDCFLADSERRAKPKNPHGTSLMFQIECFQCGKNETVNFVPKDLYEPICTDCFEKNKKAKQRR